MAQAIKKAAEEVAEQGWENADLKLVMLAGFGFLAHELQQKSRWNFKIVLPALGGAGILVGFLVKVVGG